MSAKFRIVFGWLGGFSLGILLTGWVYAQGPTTFQYVYDEIGQLIKVIDSTGTVIEYVYDEVGNILEVKRSTVAGLAIFNFTPSKGTIGAMVTIQGQGFSPVAGGNIVEFNGVSASVGAATQISLETTVPAGATSGPISVTVAGITATSGSDFIVIAQPQIASIYPPGGVPGQLIPEVTVAGVNLTDSVFSFLPPTSAPVVSGSPAVDFGGVTATMTVSVDPSASGTFAVVATNGSGSSDPAPGPANSFRILDPLEDEDGDGLTNGDEAALGTDLFNVDTDGDGLWDGQEVAAGTDPLNPTTTLPVGCGELLSGSIDAAGEVDLFTFTGTTGVVLDLVLTETPTWGGSSGNAPRATVFSPTGVQADQFNGTAQRQLTLAETGTYLVRVDANNQVSTGSYNLGLTCLLPTSPPPTPMACGELLSGSIDIAGEVDLVSFTGTTGDRIDLVLTESPAWGGSSGNAPRASVFSPTGVQVDQFDGTAQRQLTLAETGTYLVRINANNLVSTGSYNLGLTCLLPTSPPPTPLACGELLSGSIGVAGEVDLISFAGTTGHVIDLVLAETPTWGGSSGNAPRATVFSPTGVQVDQFDATRQRQLTLTETGTYLVRINANNLVSTGSYNLGLTCLLPTSPSPTPLACGELLSGSIGVAGEVDLFSFAGTTGHVIDLVLTETPTWGGSSGNAPRATVISPTGVQVDQVSATSQRQLTLAETGTYLVRINANNLVSTGSYNLGLTCLLPTSPPPTPLACGGLLSASIGVAGEVDVLSFTGTTGHVIDLVLTESPAWGGSSGNAPRATVFSPTGVQVDQFNGTAQRQLTLAETGTYLVRVNANNLVSTGSYNLGLTCLLPTSPPPTPLACGGLLSGSIDVAGEVDLVSFTGTTGDVIDLVLTETPTWGGSSGNAPRATVFSPTGVQLEQFDGTAQRQLTLAETGTYLIRINANNLVSTGSYELDLQCTSPPP